MTAAGLAHSAEGTLGVTLACWEIGQEETYSERSRENNEIFFLWLRQKTAPVVT